MGPMVKIFCEIRIISTTLLVIISHLSRVESADLIDLSGQPNSPKFTWSGFNSPTTCATESVTNVTFHVQLDLTTTEPNFWKERAALKFDSDSVSELAVAHLNICPPSTDTHFYCVKKNNGVYDLEFDQVAQGAYSHMKFNIYIMSTDYTSIAQTSYHRYPYVKEALYPVLTVNEDSLKIDTSLERQDIKLERNATVNFTMHHLEYTDFTYTLLTKVKDDTGNYINNETKTKTDATWMTVEVNAPECVTASYQIHDNQLDSACAKASWEFCFIENTSSNDSSDSFPPWAIAIIVVGVISLIVVCVLYIIYRRRGVKSPRYAQPPGSNDEKLESSKLDQLATKT